MHRLPHTLALAVPILLAVAAMGARAEDVEAQVVETAHYRLVAETSPEEALEMGRFLEAAWPQLAAHFGDEPRLRGADRLHVRFLATHDRWAAALREAGVTPPTDAGGYYDPGSRTAFLYRQGTRYFTRVLLLHEATHQFHYLARTRNARPSAGWFREGVAEHLSWHLWDGEHLEIAVRPPISLKDHAATALEAVSADGFDLEAVIEDRSWPGYPVAWALYRYLATARDGEPVKGFDALRRKLDDGGGSGPAFKRVTRNLGRFQDAFTAWLGEIQQPWVSVYAQWDPRGVDHLLGVASVVSVCRLKEPTRRIEASLDAFPPRGRCGLLLHFTGADDYTVALLADGGRRLQVDRRAGGRWIRLANHAVAADPAGGVHRLEARRAEDGVYFSVGTREFGPFSLPEAPMGLAIDACEREFRDVRWEAAQPAVGETDRDP